MVSSRECSASTRARVTTSPVTPDRPLLGDVRPLAAVPSPAVPRYAARSRSTLPGTGRSSPRNGWTSPRVGFMLEVITGPVPAVDRQDGDA